LSRKSIKITAPDNGTGAANEITPVPLILVVAVIVEALFTPPEENFH
jgi:hypothetical protein